MNAWDELADAIDALPRATGVEAAAVRKVLAALRKVAEQEGTRDSYRAVEVEASEGE